MTDKDMNMAILGKLYEIADGVWERMTKNTTGSFTASEVYKNRYGEFWLDSQDENRDWEVSVGTFSCTFPTWHVFRLVAAFENLARVGSKKRLFKAEEQGTELGTVTFAVTKEMRDLCDFAGGKNDPNPTFQSIFIDTSRNCLVATDGHKVLARPVSVTERHGDIANMQINAKDFGKMCAKMKGKGTYQITARKMEVGCDLVTRMEFGGIISTATAEYGFPDWAGVFTKRSSALRLSVMDWESVRKFAKSCDDEVVVIKGNSGEGFFFVEAENGSMKVPVFHVVQYGFKLYLSKAFILAAGKTKTMALYLGKDACDIVQAVDGSGNLYLSMPFFEESGYVGERFGDELMRPNAALDVDLLQQYVPLADVSSVADSAPVPAAKKIKEKFTFEAIGVKPGDVLTFVDGTEVVAGDNTTVWYDGEEYTLSGFCRKFMPDEKRHKANSYRGCVFFYRDGVKLEKLYKEARKAVSVNVVDNAEHVGEVKASVSTTVEKPDIAQPVVSVACAMQPLAVLAPGFALPSVARETEVVHRHAVRHVRCRVGAPGIGIGRAYVTGRRSTACHKVAHALPHPPPCDV